MVSWVPWFPVIVPIMPQLLASMPQFPVIVPIMTEVSWKQWEAPGWLGQQWFAVCIVTTVQCSTECSAVQCSAV